MKGGFSFWLITCIGIGASVGMPYDNLPAGLSFGAAAGILANLFTWNIYHKAKK